MNKKKGVLQKLSLVLGVVSFALAFISGVILYLRVESVSSDTISASLMGSTFFFVCIGAVFTTIWKADIPSFKFDNSEKK